ncbi:hypothetical protein [Streptomyces californicus]|uniref:hypothetical protein n=1 Tax=Streptomyces californicus TaxID=67351 RepID=UPI00296E66E1|nr:hypothetical protein [Streptomyces californicus]MDW4913747.1 hypothetical protein [Streptomyces californicus]
MDSGWMAVWPVAAFFLGGLATQVTGWLTHRRQQLERKQDAAAALHARRESFELDQLQKLSDALQNLGRKAAQVHHADMMAGRESRLYGAERLAEELDEAHRLAHQEVRMLSRLVLNDDLREQLADARSAMLVPSAMNRADPRAAEAAFVEGLQKLDQVMDEVAAQIREIYLSSTTGQTLAPRV